MVFTVDSSVTWLQIFTALSTISSYSYHKSEHTYKNCEISVQHNIFCCSWGVIVLTSHVNITGILCVYRSCCSLQCILQLVSQICVVSWWDLWLQHMLDVVISNLGKDIIFTFCFILCVCLVWRSWGRGRHQRLYKNQFRMLCMF